MSDFFKIKLQFILGYAGILLFIISIRPVFLSAIIFSSVKLNLTISNILAIHLFLVIIAIVFYGIIFSRDNFNKKSLPKLFGDLFYLLAFLWVLIVLVSYLVITFIDNYSYYLNRKTIPPSLLLCIILIMLILLSISNKYIKNLKIKLLEYIYSNSKIDQRELKRNYKIIYRLIDIALSSFSIFLSLPILLITYFYLKLESRTSSIIKIKKVGRNGKEFDTYKFRTSILTENGESKTSKIGSFLRRAAIDELPILFNVLFNNMTLIGLRPHSNDSLKMFDEEYQNFYKKYKPGVLSLFSIVALDKSFQNYLDFNDISKIDTFYISNKSLYLDFMMALSTVKLVIFYKN